MSLTRSELYNFINASNLTGESAYDIWKYLNPDGTEEQFIEALRGKSAMEYWLELEINNGKTEQDFINWLSSDNSTLITNETAAREAGDTQTLIDAKAYIDEKIAEEITNRESGDSQTLISAKAYTDEQLAAEKEIRELAIANVLEAAKEFTNTQISQTMQSNYDLWLSLGYEGSADDFIEYLRGESAYEIWVNQEGNEGKSEADFLKSLGVSSDDLNESLTDSKTYTDTQLEQLKNLLESSINSIKETAENAVPKTTTINGESLDSDITLDYNKVGADPSGSSDKALEDAKSYTDKKIADIMGVGDLPETLDTMIEFAQALQNNDNAISAINEAIGKKQSTITGAATTIVDDNLDPNKVVISNTNGKIAVSTITTTELGYLSNLTGNVQAQINKEISDRDTAINNSITTTKQYTDEKVAAEVTARDAAITNIFNQAKQYTDAQIDEQLQSNYDLWLSLGYEGTPNDFLEFLKGESAYDIWVKQEGNSGKTEEEFLSSIANSDLNYTTATDTPGFLGTVGASVNAQSLVNNMMERIASLELLAQELDNI